MNVNKKKRSKNMKPLIRPFRYSLKGYGNNVVV